MDHLGIRQFMVLGFCIGGPFIWNVLKRAGDRVVAAVPVQPSGYRPDGGLTALAHCEYPNGLALLLDEPTMYVANMRSSQ
jgi:dienelactone hydrolase